MDREQSIQRIIDMLLQATDEQLNKLLIFIKAFLKPGE